jgi:hypothetical protein
MRSEKVGLGEVTQAATPEFSLAEFHSSLHQQLCGHGSDGANGFINAKPDPGDMTFGGHRFSR